SRRPVQEDWGDAVYNDWVDGYGDWLQNSAFNSFVPQPMTTVNWRKHGKDYPFFQNETQLNYLRAPARILCARNSYAIGVMEGICSYTIGTGFKHRVVPK